MQRRLVAATLAATAALAGVATARGATATASSYDLPGNTLGCGGTLTSSAHVVASKTLRCGTRLTVCVGRRCTWAVVRDRGPYVPGRSMDLNLGVVRALGFANCATFGVRSIRWYAR